MEEGAQRTLKAPFPARRLLAYDYRSGAADTELMLICDSSSRTTTVYYMKDRSHTALVCLAKANGSERDTERLEA